jgi:hypothetical protein
MSGLDALPGWALPAAHACPYCGATSNAVAQATTGIGGDPPADGDLSLRWPCGEVAVFVVGPLGTVLRVPTPDELREIAANEDTRRARHARLESFGVQEAVELLRPGATSETGRG